MRNDSRMPQIQYHTIFTLWLNLVIRDINGCEGAEHMSCAMNKGRPVN